MQITRNRLLWIMMVGAGSLTAQDDCKLALDATIKAFDVPVHAYVTMDISGMPCASNPPRLAVAAHCSVESEPIYRARTTKSI
jgi:hypothetical protein